MIQLDNYPVTIPGTDLEIIDHIAVLSTDKTRKVEKHLNIVEFKGELRYDIREYTSDMKKASAGVLLTDIEAQELVDALYELDIYPTFFQTFFEDPGYVNERYRYETDADSPLPGQESLFPEDTLPI